MPYETEHVKENHKQEITIKQQRLRRKAQNTLKELREKIEEEKEKMDIAEERGEEYTGLYEGYLGRKMVVEGFLKRTAG